VSHDLVRQGALGSFASDAAHAKGIVVTITEAVLSRRSVRGFSDHPVPRAILEDILTIAARAPSGVNHQPWRAHVVTGTIKDELSRKVLALRDLEPDRETHPKRFGEYDYYPAPLPEPYLSRRRKVGWDLYRYLGVVKGDREGTWKASGRNYSFFGAPVGIIFTIDKTLEQGSWLDYGMFIQSIMLVAREFGLDSCAQGAWCHYYDVIREHLAIPPTQMVVCGMSLGYADPKAPTDPLRTERMALHEFVTFHQAA
jgi:nitroreductase